LDAFREAVALVLTALAGHSEPMARDAAALSGMAGDVMGNRHAGPVAGGLWAVGGGQDQAQAKHELRRVVIDLASVGPCKHCGWHEHHQPYGFSAVVECNRCGAQHEHGKQDGLVIRPGRTIRPVGEGGARQP
jgi:hypothetical protein